MKTISIGLAAMALCTLAACATPTAMPVPSALPTPSAEAARATTTNTFVAAATNTPEPRASSTATTTDIPAPASPTPEIIVFLSQVAPMATEKPSVVVTFTVEQVAAATDAVLIDAASKAIDQLTAPDFTGMRLAPVDVLKGGEGKLDNYDYVILNDENTGVVAVQLH